MTTPAPSRKRRFLALLGRLPRALWRGWMAGTPRWFRAYLAGLFTWCAGSFVYPDSPFWEHLSVSLLGAYVYWEHAKATAPLVSVTNLLVRHVEYNVDLEDMVAGGPFPGDDFGPCRGQA